MPTPSRWGAPGRVLLLKVKVDAESAAQRVTQVLAARGRLALSGRVRLAGSRATRTKGSPEADPPSAAAASEERAAESGGTALLGTKAESLVRPTALEAPLAVGPVAAPTPTMKGAGSGPWGPDPRAPSTTDLASSAPSTLTSATATLPSTSAEDLPTGSATASLADPRVAPPVEPQAASPADLRAAALAAALQAASLEGR